MVGGKEASGEGMVKGRGRGKKYIYLGQSEEEFSVKGGGRRGRKASKVGIPFFKDFYY